jgi:hypothetical protein
VCATTWSEPTYNDGSIITFESHTAEVTKPQCDKTEWNNNFEQFRSGELEKEDMLKYTRTCKW